VTPETKFLPGRYIPVKSTDRSLAASQDAGGRDPRVSYTMRILSNGEDSLPIIYGPVAPVARTAPAVYIVPSGFFDEATYGAPRSLPQLPLANIEDVPLLFGVPSVERQGQSLVVRADIVASAYFLTTRYEEWVRRDVRDEHGRFPGRESLPYRAGFLHRPIVDEYAGLLRQWLGEIGVHLPESPTQLRKTYLTHDIDVPWRWARFGAALRSSVGNVIRARGGGFDPMRCYLGWKTDPEDCFDWILEQDRILQQALGAHQVELVFFLMAGGKTACDGRYGIRSRRAKRLIEKLVDSGASIGLHTSYRAGANPGAVKREADMLRNATGLPITRNRYHYLACREPEDLRQLEQAGIRDDFSFAYADVAGFRLGTSRPIRWFDPLECRLTEVTLHPLTVMDCTLDRADYMHLSYEEARSICFSLSDQVKRHNGELVLLWHNTELTEERQQHGVYQRRLYQDMLRWTQDNGQEYAACGDPRREERRTPS
jgi:hypothetical protein